METTDYQRTVSNVGTATSVLEDRRKLTFTKELTASGWFHSMSFPDGEVIEGYTPLPVLRQRYAEFGLPDDLQGRRALDIGAWDGWFSFELERHGAAVTAVDLVEVKNFLYARERLQSKVEYVVSDVYDLPELQLAPFDYVLFLGVLYHLRHPLLALETVCSLTTETAVIDSFVIDAEESDDNSPVPHSDVPSMEFYETDELGGNIDNWFGPTTECLMALCRSAGFARVEYVNTWHRHARVLCHRRWEPAPALPTTAPPVLTAVRNARDYGANFHSRKEQYLTLWFTSPIQELDRHDLRPEISGFGSRALSLTADSPENWMINVRLPPGLRPGRHGVRLRTSDSGFSNECFVFVDTSAFPGQLEIRGIFDGVSWRENVAVADTGRFVTMYAGGLAENSDTNNVEVWVGEICVRPTFIGSEDANGSRQVNLQLPLDLALGEYPLKMRQAGKLPAVAALTIIA